MSCIFCDIASGKMAAKILHQDDKVVAFADIHPQAPFHILVIPVKHISNINEVKDEDSPLLGHIFKVIQDIAKKNNIAEGYRVITNCGASAGQSVLHLHFHIMGGRHFHWPPG